MLAMLATVQLCMSAEIVADYKLHCMHMAQVQRSSSEELAFQPAARFEPVMQEVHPGFRDVGLDGSCCDNTISHCRCSEDAAGLAPGLRTSVMAHACCACNREANMLKGCVFRCAGCWRSGYAASRAPPWRTTSSASGASHSALFALYFSALVGSAAEWHVKGGCCC